MAEAKAPDTSAAKGTPVGRRVFLGMVGLGAAGVVFGSKAQDWLEHVLAPIPARDGTGLSAFLPVGRFRIYSVTGDLPSKSVADYRLKVGGHVDQALELTFADLQAMPPTNLDKDFQCVTGWRVHNVKWTGVRLGDLLTKAGMRPGAGGVEFHSFDGEYTESLTLEQALRPDVLVTLAGRWGKGFRADVSRLNRWTKDDTRWFRSLGRDPYVQLGKFHPGQKLNASFIAGVIVVMLATGSVMNWFHYFPVDWRTGATFVHDWIAVILFVVVVGHIGMALADPEALGSMVRGWVDARWARDRAPRWYAEIQ